MSTSEIVLDPGAWKDVEPGTEALLDEWLVRPGDAVRAGQPVARVVLVKASLEVTAPADGRLQAIAVAEGETFAAGRVLGTVAA